MSHKQENVIDNGTSTSTVEKSFSSKTIINAENSKPYAANPRTGGNFNLISPTKSKFFMPKPRISSHSIILNNKLQVKSMINLKNYSLQPNAVAEENTDCSTINEQQTNENPESIHFEKEESEIELNNAKAACDMLAITISCVMLMASKAPTIPDEYLSWAERYLSHIKDKNGDHPPNVQGILNHIKYIRIRNLTPETSISKIKCSCVPDIRSRSSSPQQSDKRKSTSGMKFRNSSASENNNRKRACSIKCACSCSTFAALCNPVQKPK